MAGAVAGGLPACLWVWDHERGGLGSCSEMLPCVPGMPAPRWHRSLPAGNRSGESNVWSRIPVSQ